MQVCGVKALVIFFDVKNLWYMGGKHGNKEWDFIHFLGFWNTKKASTLTWSILWSFKCIPLRKSQWCDFLELPPLDWVFFFLSLPIEALYGMTTCLSHHLQPIFVRVRHLWSRDPPFWRPWTSKTLSFKVCIPKPTLCITCVHLEAPNVCMW